MAPFLIEYDGAYYEVPLSTPDGCGVLCSHNKPVYVSEPHQIAQHGKSWPEFKTLKAENIVPVRAVVVRGKPPEIGWFATLALKEDAGLPQSNDHHILRQLPPSLIEFQLASRFKSEDPTGLISTTYADTHKRMSLIGNPLLNGWTRFEGRVVSHAAAPAPPMRPVFSLPTAEEFVHEMTTNRYLAAVLTLAHAHKDAGYGGVDCSCHAVAGRHLNDERELDESEGEFCDELEQQTSLNEKRAITPFLQRAGFHVLLFEEEPDDCPMSICWRQCPTHLAVTQEIAQAKRGFFYPKHRFPSRTFKIVRQRGVIKCVPKLLAWLRQARIRLAAPDRMDMGAEAAALNEEMAVDAPLVDRDAQQQAALKQQMRDSIHVDARTIGGNRWAAVTGPALHNPHGPTLVRVEAAANGHMALRPSAGQTGNVSGEVVLVPDRDIHVEWVGHGTIKAPFWALEQVRAGVWLEETTPEFGWHLDEIEEGVERARIVFANRIETYARRYDTFKLTLWSNGTVDRAIEKP